MAYDPADPADKKIVDKLIQDALAEQATEHETSTKGLKDQNTKLLKQVKNTGAEGETIAELETRLAGLETENRSLTRAKNAAERDKEVAAKTLADVQTTTKNLRVNTGLTEALTAANVAAPLQEAARALLRDRVEVKALNGEEVLAVGEKSLGDFIKEWSLGDQGKHFVIATANNGGKAPGNQQQQQQQGGKTMTRAAYEETVANNPASISGFFAEGGSIVEAT